MSAYLVTIEPQIKALIRKIEADRWARELSDLDNWFEEIETAKEVVRRRNLDHEYEMSDQDIADYLALVVKISRRLDDHVIEDVGAEIGDSDWPKMCLAAAWIILDCYYRNKEEGL